MSQKKYSLLYPDTNAQYRTLSDVTMHDLGMDQICKKLSTKERSKMITEVTLPEMLEARERRSARQQALLRTYDRTMICFTMNIAGPVKNSSLIRRGYASNRKIASFPVFS